MKLLLFIACIIGMAFSAPCKGEYYGPILHRQPKPFLLQSQWDPWRFCSQLTARGSLLEDLTTPLGSTCQIQL
ncbi:hypothetical protein CHARACLAT_006809 [Characodon lateralis]|uniref:Uncharacterized protein n=1 Tax=Characodon lateralis TaxID=208331 RepID=A0ABU7E7N2_9TELE|nr:hypothetical protein [Characodon lateralis]